MSLGELERAVMEQLWSNRGPQSVRDVHGALTRNRELAYTTVMTVLDRLAKKGLVNREMDGRAYRYDAAQTREQLAAEAMVSTLENTSHRTAVLVEFVSRVTPEEATAMREALARLEQSGESTSSSS